MHKRLHPPDLESLNAAQATKHSSPPAGGLYPGPDNVASTRYYRRFLAALETHYEKPENVLKEFRREYALEFHGSEWVATAVGRLSMGLLGFQDEAAKKTAQSFLSWYWSYELSPIRKREVKALSALIWYDSPCREHWALVVRWVRSQKNQVPMTESVAAVRYIRSQGNRWECLSMPVIELLCYNALKNPKLSEAEIVFKSLAEKNGISAKTLWSYQQKLVKKS